MKGMEGQKFRSRSSTKAKTKRSQQWKKMKPFRAICYKTMEAMECMILIFAKKKKKKSFLCFWENKKSFREGNVSTRTAASLFAKARFVLSHDAGVFFSPRLLESAEKRKISTWRINGLAFLGPQSLCWVFHNQSLASFDGWNKFFCF